MSTEKILEIGLLTLLTAGFMSLGYAQVYEFDNCGAEGFYGPDPGDCDYDNFSVDIVGEGIQEWEVPETGTYEITARGARGKGEDDGDDYRAGEGAIIQGEFQLSEGEILRVLVGQKGSTCEFESCNAGAGGGGTFVTKNVDFGDEMFDGQDIEPLIIAGGGGGSGNNGHGDGGDGSSNNEATSCSGDGAGCGSGGNLGEGGEGGVCDGFYGTAGGGGGYLTDGEDGESCDNVGEGGESFIHGGLGGEGGSDYNVDGGFGGGGGHAGNSGASGAGGGYTGGGGGNDWAGSEWGAGGGGGSFNEGNNQNNQEGGNAGHGSVEIKLIEAGGQDFCNFRGPQNECVMNETNQLQEQEYNVSSIFESRSNAVFEAFNGPATLSLENTTRISGLWRGKISIESEEPRLEAGASFRPEGEIIVIGN